MHHLSGISSLFRSVNLVLFRVCLKTADQHILNDRRSLDRHGTTAQIFLLLSILCAYVLLKSIIIYMCECAVNNNVLVRAKNVS